MTPYAGAVDHTSVAGGDAARAARAWRRARWLMVAFYAACALFLVSGCLIAARASWAGTWDSVSNIEVARSLASGGGFTARSVQNFVAPIALPGPETIRPPGAIYLLALAYKLFGTGNWVHIVLNLLTVVVTALVIRATVRALAGGAVGDVAGMLLLLAPRNYELLSWWNNNLLTLFTALALFVAVRAQRGTIRGLRLAAVIGLLAGGAFLVKQSYVLSLGLLAVILLGAEPGASWGARAGRVAAAGLIGAAVSAVYWVPNLVEHHTPLYSPAQALHLPIRYGIIPLERSGRTVLFGRAPYTYADIASAIGWGGIVRRELAGILDVMRILVRQSGPVLLLLGITALVATRARGRLYASAAALAVSPVFDAMYWIAEPRYLVPVYPIVLTLAAAGLADVRDWAADQVGPRLRHRLVVALGALAFLQLAYTALDIRSGWRGFARQSRMDAPSWVPAVARTPRDAVVLTGLPPFVNYWGDRLAVMAPVGSRADLDTVLTTYRPTHFLVTGEPPELRPAFRGDELKPLAAGEDWALYEIRR